MVIECVKKIIIRIQIVIFIWGSKTVLKLLKKKKIENLYVFKTTFK